MVAGACNTPKVLMFLLGFYLLGYVGECNNPKPTAS
jgi:hypothetical protein